MKEINLMDNLDKVVVGTVVTIKNELNDIRETVIAYDKTLNKIEFTNNKKIMVDYVTPDMRDTFKIEV